MSTVPLARYCSAGPPIGAGMENPPLTLTFTHGVNGGLLAGRSHSQPGSGRGFDIDVLRSVAQRVHGRIHAVGVKHPDRKRRPDIVICIKQLNRYQLECLLVELDGNLKTRKRALRDAGLIRDFNCFSLWLARFDFRAFLLFLVAIEASFLDGPLAD